MRSIIHCRLGVVAVVEPAASAFHDRTIRVGKVILGLGLGVAEFPRISETLLWLAAVITQPAAIVGGSFAYRADLSLERIQTFARRLNHRQTILASFDFGRQSKVRRRERPPVWWAAHSNLHNFRGYSLIETCKANHVDPYGYWVALFCSFPLAWSADDFESLLPRRLAQAAS